MQKTALAAIVDDDRYADFLSATQQHFAALIADSPHLFVTDATGLWETYLDLSPERSRQSRTCNCCRAFIQRFGGLVSLSPEGKATSAVWAHDAPPLYVDISRALSGIVERANVQGVFRTKEAVLGVPATGPWTHLALVAPLAVRWNGALTTAGQEMAAKVEEFKMLERSLAEFSVDHVRQAVALLASDGLCRPEKCQGVAAWLLELHEAIGATRNQRTKSNLMWLAVAKAPAGYCHVRSGMIGTLLEDIAAGLPFETVKRDFAEKMNPLQYMRPQAAPTAGNVAQAERVVATLQGSGSLARRFAKLADVQALWLPKASDAQPAEQGGVFGHLTKRAAETVTTSSAPATTMTWVKFLATVLPTAEAIGFLVPNGLYPYTAMVTAKDHGAPNLLQWDNPVSHYVYSNGSPPSQWNLAAGQHRKVTAVTLRSWMWGDAAKFAHHGAGVVFVLDGCRDMTYQRSGGMFPEQMKAEYRAVHRTLEAHFGGYAIEGKDEAEACGISFVKGSERGVTLRVTSRGMRASYKLDRWD